MKQRKSFLDRQVLIVTIMSVMLLATAIYLYFERSNQAVTVAGGDIPSENVQQQENTDIIAVKDATTSREQIGTAGTMIGSKYIAYGSCRDYDTDKAYFVRTFIGNYKYTNGGYVSDYCAEDFDTSTLVEMTCTEGKISSEQHRCPYGCLLGACMTQKESGAFLKSNVASDPVEWQSDGVAFSIVGGYVGDMFAPINTYDNTGSIIDIGTQIHGLALILDIRNTTDAKVCAPLELTRVVDETGAVVEPNMNEFYFGFNDIGCSLPAHAQTQYKIIFLTEPGETDFVISTGDDVFSAHADKKTGAVTLETTVPMG